jgi:hypothetical protein
VLGGGDHSTWLLRVRAHNLKKQWVEPEDREVPNRSSNEPLLMCRTYVGELEWIERLYLFSNKLASVHCSFS